MNRVFNREQHKWIRPWNEEKFDDLYNRDERFFSIIIKGLISWLNRNILMYDKSINHFIFNTGSSYLYMESNGYEYNLQETTGEDTMYMQLPRCLIEFSNLRIPTEELTAPFSRGNYERRDGNLIRGYNAEIRRLPIEMDIRLQYFLATYNELLVLLQELIDKLVFQKYYNITYLGNIIQCSIEFPAEQQIQINKIDMSAPDPNQKTIELNIIISTNYPLINERTAVPTDKVIGSYGYEIDLDNNTNYTTDVVNTGTPISDIDGFKEFENTLGDNSNNNSETINEKENYIFDNVGEPYNEDTKDNNMVPDENNQISINTDNIDDEFIKNLDTDADSNIDLEDLINKYDTNGDGIIDETELEDILEKIKNDYYDENTDYSEQCHYKIDYVDLCYAIKLVNKQSNVSAEYDRITKKIYVTHYENGEVKEIDIAKYKIVKKYE